MPKTLWIFAVACACVGALAGLPGVGAAESPRFSIDHFTTDQGLPENAVIALTQTRDGYLWMGTLDGLARFDGIHFTVFNEDNTPGLVSSRIVCLFEDSQGRLWVGTENAGVMVVKDGRIVSLDFGRGGFERRLVSICEDATGAVWLYAADGQLARYRNAGMEVWSAFAGLSVCRVVIAEKSGPVWLGLDQGMGVLNTKPSASTGNPPMEQMQILPPGGKLDFLLASGGGGFWRLGEGQVQKWAADRLLRTLAPYPWHPGTRITAACEDHQGNLIVGTLGEGLFWFDAEGKATSISTNQGLSNNSILALQMDHEGTLWVGTDSGGLNRVRRQVIETLAAARETTVRSVAGDRAGGVWLGFNKVGPEAKGAAHWTEGLLQNYGPEEGLRNATVASVFVSQDTKVWAGTRGGLFELEDGHFRLARPTLAQAILQDHAGRLWFGTQDGLTQLAGSNDWRNFTTRDGLSFDDVRALADDADGNLWAGTSGGGLNRLRDGKFTVFKKSDSELPSDNITALIADHDGVLWAGTYGSGLARMQGDKWTRYGVKDGLISNSIRYLLEDEEAGQAFLWIGCNNGLMRVPKKDLQNFAQGLTSFIPARAYGKVDGMPDSECSAGSQPAACRTPDGRLWFATIKGVAVVDPARLTFNTNPPPVVIESVLVENQEQNTNGLRAPLPETVTIPAGKEQLDIEFTSLDFAAPERARFRWWLEGYERQSLVARDGHAAHYPKLPPGQYHFHVTACNEDGVWNEQGATLAVIVLPPFWQKWWFQGAVAAGVLLIIVGVVHYVSTQRLQRQLAGLQQQQALETERARIARDIHDQVGASLTQVSLLGEMVESDKDSPAEVESHARQITQTARETSRALDEIVWTVNPSNDTLDGLVTYLCKHAQEYLEVAGLRFRLDVPAQLPPTPISPEVRHNVFLAAKEAVTNIVKHARATEAWLRLRVEPAAVILEIQDNGRGPAGVDTKAAASRNGLRNMRKRMEDVGGGFFIGPAPEGGAIVRLTVPLRNP